jgi:hypothetical protein
MTAHYFTAKRRQTTVPKSATPSIRAHEIIMEVRTSPADCGFLALPSIAALAIRPIPYAAPIVTSPAPKPDAICARFGARFASAITNISSTK